MTDSRMSTGQPAKVFTGIRDVPIYAGESSSGNRLPGGPYRTAELVAIGLIMAPTLGYFSKHHDGGFTVLVAGIIASFVVTVTLRIVLPKRRPSLASRTVFAIKALGWHRCAADHDRAGPHDG